MNASYTLLYIKAAMLKKRKQCPCKPSSVFLYQMLLCCVHIRYKNVCHLSSPKVALGLKHSTLHSSPKAIGRAALNLRYT